MITQQLILDVWEQMGADSIGAAELTQIDEAIVERIGKTAHDDIGMSPATIARILADQGAQLRHPEVLEADRRWRERQESLVFDDTFLNSPLCQVSSALLGKIQRGEFENEESMREFPRQTVAKLKREFELIAASKHSPDLEREMAKEMVQCLTVFLENPQIVRDWVTLRTATPEFQDLMKRADKQIREVQDSR